MNVRISLRPSTVVVLLAWLCSTPMIADEVEGRRSSKSSPASVKQIFRTRCLECHGDTRREADIHILDLSSYVGDDLAVVPGDLSASYLFDLISTDDEDYRMPEIPRPPLSPQEIEAVRTWIADGAKPFPDDIQKTDSSETQTDEPEFGQSYVLSQILAYVRDMPREERRYVRFFSSNHLLTSGATAEELKRNAQALAKSINHLSWQPGIAKPVVVDRTIGSVFAVDIRRLGWHETPFRAVSPRRQDVANEFDLFDLVLLDYPYGVAREGDEQFDQLYEIYMKPAGLVRPVPFVRIDWFVGTAMQPPLYEDLLQLPRKLQELELELGVRSEENIDSHVARRAGMTLSGVSQNNRVVERHPARYGYYWKSFDFETSSGLQNMFVDPLDFHYAGGEMIWSLPNGLQGYLVTDNQGNRILEAPTSIVTDKFAEDKTVRNGLSCIRCHDRGMKRFRDNIRNAFENLPSGTHRRDVLRLYPESDEMDQLLDDDQAAFLFALSRTLGEAQGQEPLIPVSRTFLDAPLTLRQAAAELGLSNSAGLTATFRLPQFAKLGLTGLSSGEVIRRDSWEDYFSQVVRQMGTGVPVPPVNGVTKLDLLPSGFAEQLSIKTNKRGNVFSPGEQLVITVANLSSQEVAIELIGTSTNGRIARLTPEIVRLGKGETYRYPETGGIDIRPQLGRELITVFGSPTTFDPGVILRSEKTSDRLLHDFFQVDDDGNIRHAAGDVVRKTLRIETR